MLDYVIAGLKVRLRVSCMIKAYQSRAVSYVSKVLICNLIHIVKM